LRFRLNSITSMLTKKEQEVGRLTEELENAKLLHSELIEKISSLEAALEESRKEVANIRAAAAVIKPVR
uniref:E3 ubiquitin protein ligase n=1 Tax=Gongylonema pulchrum TaxID=637853 RepID=A0A183DUT3_9BILA